MGTRKRNDVLEDLWPLHRDGPGVQQAEACAAAASCCRCGSALATRARVAGGSSVLIVPRMAWHLHHGHDARSRDTAREGTDACARLAAADAGTPRTRARARGHSLS